MKIQLKAQIKEVDQNHAVIVPVVERKKPTKKEVEKGEKTPLIGLAAKFWKDQPACRVQIGFDHPDQHKNFKVGQSVKITIEA